LGAFVRSFPEPFVVWGALLAALAALLAGSAAAAMLVLVVAALFVARRRGPALVIVFALLPIQALAGYRRHVTTLVTPAAVERVGG
ncbi:MAG: hypothetical protein RLW62_11805, partial [Gammaproteobacteria bacterium]